MVCALVSEGEDGCGILRHTMIRPTGEVILSDRQYF